MWLFNPDADLIDERAANRDAMTSLIKIDPFESMVPYGVVNGGEFIVNGVYMSEKDLEQFAQRGGINYERFDTHDLREAVQEELVSNGTIFTDPNINPYTNLEEALGILPDPSCTVLDSVTPDKASAPDAGTPVSPSATEQNPKEKDAATTDSLAVLEMPRKEGKERDGEISVNPYHTVLDTGASHVPEHGIPTSFCEIEKMRREKTSHGDSNHDEEVHSV